MVCCLGWRGVRVAGLLPKLHLGHRTCGAAMASAGPQGLPPRAQAVLDFWLGVGWEAAPRLDTRQERSKVWFFGGAEVDREIVEKFGRDCAALLAGEYDDWLQEPLPAVAGIIIGDQLARNAFRNSPQMFAADEKILSWAKHLTATGASRQLTPIQRVWATMPYMHSEALADQEECVRLFGELAGECEAEEPGCGMAKMAQNNLKYAVAHRDVVQQWGRFPHRNAILGRESTPEEAAGLAVGSIAKF